MTLQNVLISGNAYVAGWGQVRNSECHTGLNGPSPFTQCNFPFKWEDKVLISNNRVCTVIFIYIYIYADASNCRLFIYYNIFNLDIL